MRFLNGLSRARHQVCAILALSCTLKQQGPNDHIQKYELLDAFSVPYGQPCLWQLIMYRISWVFSEALKSTFSCTCASGGSGGCERKIAGWRAAGAEARAAGFYKQHFFPLYLFFFFKLSLTNMTHFSISSKTWGLLSETVISGIVD